MTGPDKKELEDFVLSLEDTDHLNLFARAPRIEEMVKRIRAGRAGTAAQLKPGDTVAFGAIDGNVVFAMAPDGDGWNTGDRFVRRPLYRSEAVQVVGSPGNWTRTMCARTPIADTELVTVVEVLNAPLG